MIKVFDEGRPFFVVIEHDGELEIGNQVGDYRGDEHGVDNLPAFFDADGKAAVDLNKADAGDGEGRHGNSCRPGSPPQFPFREAEKPEKDSEKCNKEKSLKSKQKRPLQFFDKLFDHGFWYPFLLRSQKIRIENSVKFLKNAR